MRIQARILPLLAATAFFGLSACEVGGFYREAGAEVDEGSFGNPTMNNALLMRGEIDATVALGNRFATEVPTTITFAFNSSQLTNEARATLRQQADWIRQFPEVRFKVFGHTDLVGSDSYNKALGMRRARAAVGYLTGLGIGSARLEAVVSFGKTQPVIQTPGPEQRNRRTVTEVSGFVNRRSMLLNGKYAEVVFREYIKYAKRPIVDSTQTSNEVTPGG